MENKFQNHSFIRLANTQLCQGTLYCAGLDPHLFPSYEKNMEVYGVSVDYHSISYYQGLVKYVSVFEKKLFTEMLSAIETYIKNIASILIEECNVYVFKPQSSFYEQLGPLGLHMLSRICDHIRATGKKMGVDPILLLDCKRGDISTTQDAYFRAILGDLDDVFGFHYKPYDFDIMNVTPWMGNDVLSLESLGLKMMKDKGKGVIVVSKSSNPTGPQYQERNIGGGRTLQMQNVIDLKDINDNYALEHDGLSTLGMVVGSTHACNGEIRNAFPTTTLLVPGFGAQGGSFDKIMKELIPSGKWQGLGAIFSSSRGTMFPFETKYGGSGDVKNLKDDLIKSIKLFRQNEKEAYADAGFSYPFQQ